MIEYGTTRYYIYHVQPPILNDADISGDGQWSCSITYDCTVGATNGTDVYWIPFRRADQVDATSFGTLDWQDADNMEDIDHATS